MDFLAKAAKSVPVTRAEVSNPNATCSRADANAINWWLVGNVTLVRGATGTLIPGEGVNSANVILWEPWAVIAMMSLGSALVNPELVDPLVMHAWSGSGDSLLQGVQVIMSPLLLRPDVLKLGRVPVSL